MSKTTHHTFEIELIDFSKKRLGLTHNPKTLSTEHAQDSSFNAFGQALYKLRKSFIPKFKKKKA